MKSIVFYFGDFVAKEFIYPYLSFSRGEGRRADEVAFYVEIDFYASLRVPETRTVLAADY